MTLRNLPQLQKLDNQLVNKDELEKSLEFGRLIEEPNLFDSNRFNDEIDSILMPITENSKNVISPVDVCQPNEENDQNNKSQYGVHSYEDAMNFNGGNFIDNSNKENEGFLIRSTDEINEMTNEISE
jgi:hypothetical protein